MEKMSGQKTINTNSSTEKDLTKQSLQQVKIPEPNVFGTKDIEESFEAQLNKKKRKRLIFKTDVKTSLTKTIPIETKEIPL